MGRYTDIVSGMLGDDYEFIAGQDDDDYELIAGLDDDDGDDLDDQALTDLVLAGATAARGKGLSKQAIRRAVQEKVAQGSTLLRETGPTKARTWHLGFDSETEIPPNTVRSVENSPQIIFRGERLIIPSDIAGSFLLRDIVVGKTSQLAATGPVPARTYQETSFGTQLQLDTAQVSQKIVLVVENTSGAPVRFNATLIGRAIE